MAWKTRLLVVANRTADSDDLLAALRERAARGADRRHAGRPAGLPRRARRADDRRARALPGGRHRGPRHARRHRSVRRRPRGLGPGRLRRGRRRRRCPAPPRAGCDGPPERLQCDRATVAARRRRHAPRASRTALRRAPPSRAAADRARERAWFALRSGCAARRARSSASRVWRARPSRAAQRHRQRRGSRDDDADPLGARDRRVEQVAGEHHVVAAVERDDDRRPLRALGLVDRDGVARAGSVRSASTGSAMPAAVVGGEHAPRRGRGRGATSTPVSPFISSRSWLLRSATTLSPTRNGVPGDRLAVRVQPRRAARR